MNNNLKKYLPIGTVVMLKGGSKRVMITGFCSMPTDDQNTMYDYSGCMYPEGFLSSDQTALFNHDQIEKVYHLGFADEEEQKFKASLNILVGQINNTTSNVASSINVNQVNTVNQSQAMSTEQSVPPVGPGLPGYVAPQTPSQPSVTSSGITTQVQSTNINFDSFN